MGVYVEKEWRYKRRGSTTFAHKINQIRKGNISSGRKGSIEVFVKFTKGGKSRAGIRNAIKYISRDYKLELLDSDGLKQSSKEDIEDTIRFMQMHTSLPQKYGVDLTKSLTFSPPKIAGVSKEDTLESVRKT